MAATYSTSTDLPELNRERRDDFGLTVSPCVIGPVRFVEVIVDLISVNVNDRGNSALLPLRGVTSTAPQPDNIHEHPNP